MSNQTNDTKFCPACETNKLTSEFYTVKTRKDGFSHKCKECLYKISQTPSALKAKKEYAERNKLKIKKWQAKWRKDNLDYKRKRDRQYKLNLKIDIINHYGGKCACCGETEIDFLAIDHTNGDGCKHRREIGIGGTNTYCWLKRNNFPEGFRVLCHNCNWGIHVNNGICPHKKNFDKKVTFFERGKYKNEKL
jgi:hypothetical protein